MSSEVKIFAGRATRYLAEKIAQSSGIPLGNVIVTSFADGEFQPSFEENIRGDDVFLVQSTFAPADNLMELLLLIDGAKRASARRIIAVIPYFGLARQDRKDKPRVPIASKLAANILTAAGVDRLLPSYYADQIQGFSTSRDHLFGSSIFITYIKQMGLENLGFCLPCIGAPAGQRICKILKTAL